MSKKVNNSFRYLILGILILGLPAGAAAQKGTIKGKVIDAKTNEPLIGATVVVLGTTNGMASDLDGNYTINNVATGKHTVKVTFISYISQTKADVIVENGKETVLNFAVEPEMQTIKGSVEIVAKANRQSENILLQEQKMSLLATQAVGAREMSRKGAGNAEAAVAQVSGVSKQEGVKNVFVRGLGDRYNATLLNGFPIPSEDPEYKNIALEFFASDIIQNIGVSKVFESSNTGDIGGAIINIGSKELFGDHALSLEVSAGLNSEAINSNFLHQAGSNFLGFANTDKPTSGKFNFHNSLDPSEVKSPINQSYTLSGGKLFRLGENRNPLSLFAVATYSTDYSYTRETIRNSTTNGTIYLDQTGEKYSQNISQLILANASYSINNDHHIAYNFMMLHANNQYVGEFSGKNGEKYQDAEDYGYMGYLRRQQTNDNLLFTHQLITDWKISDKWKLNAGASYNSIKGLEPDRRENNLSKKTDELYGLTASNRQKRFFSELNENDVNVKAALKYKLEDAFDNRNSALIFGYDGRFVKDRFEATEYNMSAFDPGYYFSIEGLKLDEYYNQSNLSGGKFTLTESDPNKYDVTKYIHSGYMEGSYQVASALLLNLGMRMDLVNMTVEHMVQHVSPGEESIDKTYYLPSMNLKYDLDDKNTLRFGMSKTYTLPQSKEISPYQYVNIGFASQGNPNLKPSDNYNLDLKWDYYLSPSEVLSITGFYKHINKPIGRVDEGNSAGLLTYENISPSATVAGFEFESRKNIFNKVNTNSSITNKLTFGLNASYIYSDLQVDIENTPKRHSRLEGSAPFLANFDVSYNYIHSDKNILASLVVNYFSDRIYTIGTMGYKDIIEEGLPTLNFVSSYKLNKNFSVKLKASNLLDPAYKLTRKSSENQSITLNEYKKGINISLGVSYDL